MNDPRTPITPPEFVSCDVMVIGGGGAGLRAAIAARSAGCQEVFLVSKSRIGHATNTYISKGIMAASGVGDAKDDAEAHLADTLEGGRFLNDPALVARMTQKIPSEVSFLTACGARFCMDGEKPKVLQIPGHRYPRHVYGDNWRGSDLVVPLKKHARRMGVRFFEHLFVTRLLGSGDRIGGAAGITAEGRFLVFQAKTVVLATGGYAQVYQNTNNAAGITGDGQALAYGLGVSLKDMEFVQFYPTALGRRGSRLFLNEKLLAQPGVTLETIHGEDIFKRNGYPDPMKVGRDRLAQLVMKEVQSEAEGYAHAVMNLEGLSPEAAAQVAQLLPSSWGRGQKKFKVVPTAHFCMGGIATDDRCETSVKGLFAVGEAAAGCHGANRLGGNALAEIFAMGSVAGEAAAGQVAQQQAPDSISPQAKEEKERLESAFSETGDPPRLLIQELKREMWRNAGITREKLGLKTALDKIQGVWSHVSVTTVSDLIKYLEFHNMRRVAEMVCRGALRRTESRGSHFRRDYPGEDNDNWLSNIAIRKGPSGMELQISAVGRQEPR